MDIHFVWPLSNAMMPRAAAASPAMIPHTGINPLRKATTPTTNAATARPLAGGVRGVP
jgi:hypothetical protein